MHCSGCGLIIGKESPADVCNCPRCEQILRISVFDVDEDERDRPILQPVSDSRSRRAAIYVSDVMLGMELADRTTRPEAWRPLQAELEEERLKAFATEVGWTVAAVHRDRGPSASEASRPFSKIERSLDNGAVNVILVSAFDRVARKDLRRLWDAARERGAQVVQAAPHPGDKNLRLEQIDYDDVPDSWADHEPLVGIWTTDATATLDKLLKAVGWHWTHYAADLLARAIGGDVIRKWREEDPACGDRHWREVLTLHAIARARRSGAVARLPLPRLLPCSLCERRFLDASLPVRLMEVSAGRGSYCNDCLRRVFPSLAVGEGMPDPDAESIVGYFRELPGDRFEAFVRGVKRRLEAAGQARSRFFPSDSFLREALDLGMLDEQGEVVLSDRLHKAADGHLNSSLGGAILDNWLSANSLRHRPDSRYPQESELNPAQSVRADFVVGDRLVEFAGLRGLDEFKKDLPSRVELARRTGQVMVLFFAEDLLVGDVMRRKLGLLGAVSGES